MSIARRGIKDHFQGGTSPCDPEKRKKGEGLADLRGGGGTKKHVISVEEKGEGEKKNRGRGDQPSHL